MIEQKRFVPESTQESQTEDISVSMASIDNVWVRLMHFKKKGDKNVPHTHTHDHATLLSSGSVKATVNGMESIFKAPCLILVHKDHLHYFEALEDDTVACCVHGLRDEDGTIVSPEMIPAGIPVKDIVTKYGPFTTYAPK